MNILYIVTRPIEINTSSSIRNAATIKGLIENGNTVDVLSAEPDKNHQGYDMSLHILGANYLYKRVGGIQSFVRVSRRLHIPKSLKKMLSSMLNQSMIYDNLVGLVDKVNDGNMDINKYDCIISSSDPKSSHVVALKLKEAAENEKVRWIQIWGDPFLDDISVIRSRRMKKKVKKEERRLLNGADKIIYVSKLTLNAQARHYPENKKKMTFLPPPYLSERISDKVSSGTEITNLVYCGDYNSRVRNIVPLAECVKRSEKLHLIVCGGGDVNIGTLENIDAYERAPRTKVNEIEESADVLVHICNRKGSQIPGKIYQYDGTNKKILFILDGECQKIKSIFEPYHRFVFCENNADDIEKALKDMMGENGKIVLKPVEEFSPHTIARQIVE